eukprot:211134_1
MSSLILPLLQLCLLIQLIRAIKPTQNPTVTTYAPFGFSLTLNETNRLPYAKDRMIVGYYNESVWLLGGLPGLNNVFEYQVNNNGQFIQHPNVSDYIYSYSQSWVQIEEIIYHYKHPKSLTNPAHIGSFNMRTRSYVPNFIAKKNATLFYPCIANKGRDFLFVIGGWYNWSGGLQSQWDDAVNAMQIFNLTGWLWIEDGPGINPTRDNHCCVVHDNTLYVIGGHSGVPPLDTVEILDIENIENINGNSWRPLQDTLSIARSGPSCVVYRHLIFVLGGYATDKPTDAVDRIDTTTNSITPENNMAYNATAVTAVITQLKIVSVEIDALFVFGGWSDPEGFLDNVQWASLLPSTYEPVASPTTFPIMATPLQTTPSTTAPLSFTPQPTTAQPTPSPTASLPATPPPTTTLPSLIAQSTLNPLPTHDQLEGEENNEDDIVMYIFIALSSMILFIGLIIFIVIGERKRKANMDMLNQVRQEIPEKCENEAMIDGKNMDTNDNIIRIEGSNIDGMDDNLNEEGFKFTVEGNVNDIRTQRIQMDDIVSSTPNPKVINKKLHKNALELQKWLEKEVGLYQYFDVFVANGYESMQIVKEISNIEELKEVGIESKQHQMKIMEAVQKWKYEHEAQGQPSKQAISNPHTTKGSDTEMALHGFVVKGDDEDEGVVAPVAGTTSN